MKNTRNDIETLATAQSVTLTGSALGNDENAIEQIATETSTALIYSGNDDNKLETLQPLFNKEM